MFAPKCNLIPILLYLVGDHIFGLIPLMASLLNGAGGVTEGGEDPRLHVNTETAVCPSFGLVHHFFQLLNSLLKFMDRWEHGPIFALALRIPTLTLVVLMLSTSCVFPRIHNLATSQSCPTKLRNVFSVVTYPQKIASGWIFLKTMPSLSLPPQSSIRCPALDMLSRRHLYQARLTHQNTCLN